MPNIDDIITQVIIPTLLQEIPDSTQGSHTIAIGHTLLGFYAGQEHIVIESNDHNWLQAIEIDALHIADPHLMDKIRAIAQATHKRAISKQETP